MTVNTKLIRKTIDTLEAEPHRISGNYFFELPLEVLREFDKGKNVLISLDNCPKYSLDLLAVILDRSQFLYDGHNLVNGNSRLSTRVVAREAMGISTNLSNLLFSPTHTPSEITIALKTVLEGDEQSACDYLINLYYSKQ